MSARDAVLGRIRQSLGRTPGTGVSELPPVRLRLPQRSLAEKIELFSAALGTLAGKTFLATNESSARDYVDSVVANRPVVMAESPVLQRCGISYSQTPVPDAEIGITGAEYALADTGTLVVMSVREPRLVSLLPPVHIAVIESERILGSLDEFFTVVPLPADAGASTVFITGPSRTADIEQILVRGVHGPGELHVVILP